MNLNQLENVVIRDIFMSDYPDFCDAYIESAYHLDGDALTDGELEALLEDDKAITLSLIPFVRCRRLFTVCFAGSSHS